MRNGKEGVAQTLALISKALAARGAADMEALRALSGIVGGGIGTDPVQGLSNATDLVQAGLDAAIKQLTASEPAPSAKRRALLIAASVAIVAVELAQFATITIVAWLIGGGLELAADGTSPLRAAAGVALGSRQITRPLRLGVQVWGGRRIYPKIASMKRGRPLVRAKRHRWSLVAGVGAIAVTALVLSRLDAVIDRPRQAAASSVLGALHLRRRSSVPPLAALAGTSARVLGVLAAALGAPRPNVVATTEAATALCHWLLGRAVAAAAGCASISQIARTIKPLRALLDLTESDSWAVDTLKAALRV